MLKSLKLYTGYFLKTLPQPERRLLWLDFRRYILLGQDHPGGTDYPESIRKESLDAGIEWLLAAQKATIDHGFCSYHLARGWSSSYPETTGYIIPTLVQYDRKNDVQKVMEAAVKAADFLVSIQKESGGWQGGRVNENKPAIVFNTGQVIRGMIATYELTGREKYLGAAVKAGRWLASVQHPEGYWKMHALMEQARVYDTFVDVPLIQLSVITGDQLFRDKAVRNLDWVLREKIRPNGWFVDCDNTIRRNDKPILHTIAYTLDGLVDSGIMLGESRFLDAVSPGATKLRDLFLERGSLNGRYDHGWNGREYFICTGGAQMAIVWMKLYLAGKGEGFRIAARKMMNYLIFIQNRETTERERTLGAIPGSFPIWGRYEPFAFPNWATKFFCDALLMEEEVNS